MISRWRDVAHIGHAELLGLIVVADGGGSWYLRGYGDYEAYCLKLTAADLMNDARTSDWPGPS